MANFGDLIARGVAASRPAAGTPGRLYFSTDTETLERDNGASWDSIDGTGSTAPDHDHTGTGDGGKLTAPKFDGYLELEQQGSDPAAPGGSSNILRIYAKDKGGTTTLYYITEGGTIYELPTLDGGGGGGSGAPADLPYVTIGSQAALSAEVPFSGLIGYGTSGSLPSAGTGGRLYFETNNQTLRRDNGSSWDTVYDWGAATWKPPVRVATTANITLSGTQTIDGVSIAAGQRVLVKDQSTASQNGIYDVAAGSWSRSFDADTGGDLVGAVIYVADGSTNANTVWGSTTGVSISLGSTPISFARVGATPTLDAVPAPTADVSLNSHKITSLATPTTSTDAATKGYVDGLTGAPADAHYVTTQAESGLSAESTLASVIGYGASGSRPAAGTAGRLYYNTSTSTLQRDNGTTWDDVEGAGSSGITVREIDGSPTNTFTTIEVTNGKLTDQGSGVARLDLSGTASGAPSSATYWTEDADGTLSAEVVVGTTGITKAAFGSRQASAKAGRLYFPTDGYSVQRDNGSSWDAWGPSFPLVKPPSAASWTWVNQGSATLTDDRDALVLAGPAQTGNNVRAVVVSAPSAPYTVTALIALTMPRVNSNGAGLIFRESSSGKFAVCSLTADGGASILPVVLSGKYTNATTYSANYTTLATYMMGPYLWLRIADNNTNRVCSWSADGRNWIAFHTVGRTDFLTADQVGIYIEAANATYCPIFNLLSWSVA